jgi:hypothetical protein
MPSLPVKYFPPEPRFRVAGNRSVPSGAGGRGNDSVIALAKFLARLSSSFIQLLRATMGAVHTIG